MSLPTMKRIALARILLGTSLIPMGQTLSFLSKRISRQAIKAINSVGSMEETHKQRLTAASELQNVSEAFPKDVCILRQE